MAKHKARRRRRVRRQVHERRTPVGAPPGVVAVDPKAPQPVMRLIAYDAEHFHEQELQNLDALRQSLQQGVTCWLNVDGLGNAEVIRAIGEIFGLHPLALEDVVNVHQHPKVEEYGDHLFIVMRAVTLGETLETDQMSLFLGKNFIVTFQQYPGDCFDPVRERLRKSRGNIRRAGTDYLAYGLLDAVVDAYFPVVEKYGRQLDELDDVIDNSVSHTAVGQIHSVRQELLVLRRTVWWMRELLNSLTRDMPLIDDETRVYLRDCYDHTLQLIDVIETDRELCSDLREFHYAKLSWRTNEIMKVLTSIATIFMPLSFVTGIYGMNFEPSVSRWNMPEREWYYGYPFALGLLALVAAGFLTWMWRRGWFEE